MRLALNYQRIDPSKGGAETYVVDLCRRLIHAGHDVDVFAHSWKAGALPEEVGAIRVEARGRTRSGRIWDFARNSERALREAGGRYDCTVGFINTWHHDVIIPQGGVHEASLASNSMRFRAGWRRWAYVLGKKANPKAWVYRAIERRQYDQARSSHVVAVSEMVRDHLRKYHGTPLDKIHVIPNAIDGNRLAMENPAAARREFRAELGLKPDDLVALFVGHNYGLKGLGPLLKAMAERRRRDPASRPIHLLACGGGRPAPFRSMIRDLGLVDVAHLMGFQPDIRPAFHASDFFVLPTYYDPCSLVVFEALACGLPVITTSCNGAGELITQALEGFVIPAPDDREALADAMSRMSDDGARRVMAEHARKLGREQSFDRHVSRLIQVFEEVARSRKPSLSPAGRRPATPHMQEPDPCKRSSWPAAKGPGSDRTRRSSPSP